VFDGARRPGAKILVSGGSRCNVTNASVRETDYWTDGSRATIRQILRALPVADTVGWLRELGVTLHEEDDGKLFPDSNRARDVLEALLREMSRTGAELVTDARVLDIARAGEGFHVHTSRGVVRAGAVVLATGGRSLPKSGSDGAGYRLAQRLGHTIVPTCPALVPLVLTPEDPVHARLSGVSHPAELTVWIEGRVAERFTGPLLWTHFGVSGPVALNASRHWERARLDGYAVRVTINLFPSSTLEQVDRLLLRAASARPRARLATLLAEWLPASAAQALAEGLGIESAQPPGFTRDRRRAVSRMLVEWELPVTGSRGFTYAEATAGGVRLDEIQAKTMASRVCEGLYLVGEVLDVDGRLGGFNFQWAWSSAFVAGRSLAGQGAGSADHATRPDPID
jgi:predicted Rossmann fold flavoprotein